MTVNNEKDLGEAVKNEQDTIEIEGDLGKKVLRIKATGKVAWIVAFGALGIAVAGALYPIPEPTTQVASKAFAATSAIGAVSILGVGTTATAISIAVAAGGVGVLNKLRRYKIVSTSNNSVILKRVWRPTRHLTGAEKKVAQAAQLYVRHRFVSISAEMCGMGRLPSSRAWAPPSQNIQIYSLHQNTLGLPD